MTRTQRICLFITDKEWENLDQKIKFFNEHVNRFQKEMDSLLKESKYIKAGLASFDI